MALPDEDRVKRAVEQVKLHLLADRECAENSWVALSLEDGSSDGILYDSKVDAISHQLHEFAYAYTRIPPGGYTPGAMSLLFSWAERTARLQRMAVLASLDTGRDIEVIQPLRVEDN